MSPVQAVPVRVLAGMTLRYVFGQDKLERGQKLDEAGLVLRLIFALVPVYARSECGLFVRKRLLRRVLFQLNGY